MGDNNDISKTLIANVPEFQREVSAVREFVEAVGEFLEDDRAQIYRFDDLKDYEHGDLRTVIDRLTESGNDLPRALPEDFRRAFFRDVNEHNAKHGTDSALRYALSTIGNSPQYRNAWVPRPHLLGEGKYYNPITGEISRLPDENRLSRIHLMYGKEEVTEEGTFFRGTDYFDDEELNIKLSPIVGEIYPTDTEVRAKDVVAKSPYLVIAFDASDFNVNTGSYLDPNTGEVYEYTLAEEAILIDEIVRHFTRGQNRPTTIKIILVVVHRMADDEFTIFDDHLHERISNFQIINSVYKEDRPVFNIDRRTIVGGQWIDDSFSLEEEFEEKLKIPCSGVYVDDYRVQVGDQRVCIERDIRDKLEEDEVLTIDDHLHETITNYQTADCVYTDGIPVLNASNGVIVGGHSITETLSFSEEFSDVIITTDIEHELSDMSVVSDELDQTSDEVLDEALLSDETTVSESLELPPNNITYVAYDGKYVVVGNAITFVEG